MKTKALGVAAATTRAEARKHSIHRHHCRADGLWDCPLHRHENTEQEALHLRRQGPGEWGVEAVGQCEGLRGSGWGSEYLPASKSFSFSALTSALQSFPMSSLKPVLLLVYSSKSDD